MRLTRPLAVIALLGVCLHARCDENHKLYQPRISAILKSAGERLPAGDKTDGARLYLANAMAKNGDYAGAKSLILSVTEVSRRAGAWSLLGLAQGKLGNDHAGAKASFELALKEASAMRSAYDRTSTTGSIATNQARSGDIEGALRLAGGVDPLYRFNVLADVARVAARAGEFAPAEALLKIARSEDEVSQANALICIGHAVAFNRAPATAALDKITDPKHKVSALLAMFGNQVLPEGEKDRLLPQALALVPQIKGADDLDFSDVIRDADLGAIALFQLDNRPYSEQEMVAQAVGTLQQVTKAVNAAKSIKEICYALARRHMEEALAIANGPNMDDITRIAALCAITRKLSGKLLFADEEVKPALIKKVEDAINRAIAIAGAMEDSERSWALASLAREVARAGDYPTALGLAEQIEIPRYKASAFGGMALAAIEQKNTAQVQSNLDALAVAAAGEPDAGESVEIIAQSVLGILEPLLEDEPIGFSEAMAGLD